MWFEQRSSRSPGTEYHAKLGATPLTSPQELVELIEQKIFDKGPMKMIRRVQVWRLTPSIKADSFSSAHKSAASMMPALAEAVNEKFGGTAIEILSVYGSAPRGSGDYTVFFHLVGFNLPRYNPVLLFCVGESSHIELGHFDLYHYTDAKLAQVKGETMVVVPLRPWDPRPNTFAMQVIDSGGPHLTGDVVMVREFAQSAARACCSVLCRCDCHICGVTLQSVG